VKVSLTIRVEVEDMAAWQAAANLKAQSISEWARRGLNQHAGGDGQPVRDSDSASLAERGAGSPGGTEKRVRSRSQSTLRHIEDVAHSATRKLKVEPSTMICEHAAAPGFCKYSSCRNHASKSRR
jgi:hypothetical protein